MIRIAIVEDEDFHADILVKYINRYSTQTGERIICTRFHNGMDFISDYSFSFDIIFMDIKMPHIDGITSAKKLREIDRDVALVFVTNLKQYAIHGYEVNALDYIVKPLSYYDFEMKFVKALNYVREHQNSSTFIDLEDGKKKILLTKLHYVEVQGRKLFFHTEEGCFETRGQLSTLEEQLRDKSFIRCDNSYLVNLHHVMEIHKNDLLVGDDTIPISRRKKAEVMQKIAEYLSGGIL